MGKLKKNYAIKTRLLCHGYGSIPTNTMFRPRAYSLLLWAAYIIYTDNCLVTANTLNYNTERMNEREKLYEQAMAAKNGHPGLFNGNVKKALSIFDMLIAKNSTDYVAKKCGYQLGEWYIIGVPKFKPWKKTYDHNFDKSIHYLSISAKLGDPRSNYLLSFIYHMISLFELENPLSPHNSNSLKNPNKIVNTCVADTNTGTGGFSNFGGGNSKFFMKKNNKDNKLGLLFNHLQIAAELGDVMALSTIGYRFLCSNTSGTKSDPRNSSNYYKKATKIILSGKDGLTPTYTLEAQLPVAILNDENIHLVPIYGSKSDIESSMDYWQHKAMKGDALAQYELAKLHDDDKQAEQLLAMAADKSHAPALRDLALVYLSRNKVEQAIKLLTKAADLGDADAATILAYILLRGNVRVKKLDTSNPSIQMGIKYLLMACRQNVPDALFLLAEIMSFKGKFGDAKWLYERSGDAGFIQSIWVMAHFHQSRGEYLKNCFDLKLIADSSPSVAKYIHLGFKLLSETNYSGSLMCFLIASYQGSLIGQLNSAYLCKLVRSNKIKLDKINLETLEFYLLLQALMQGSNYALYSIANIFNESDTGKALEIYKKSFLYGDCRSILPLVKQFHRTGETDKAIELLQFYNNKLKRMKINFIGDILKDGGHIFRHYANKFKISFILKLLHMKKKIELIINKS